MYTIKYKTESDLQKKLWSWNRNGGIFVHMLIDYLELFFFLIYAQNSIIQLTNKTYVKYQNVLYLVW